jgi:hypothetical protein
MPRDRYFFMWVSLPKQFAITKSIARGKFFVDLSEGSIGNQRQQNYSIPIFGQNSNFPLILKEA